MNILLYGNGESGTVKKIKVCLRKLRFIGVLEGYTRLSDLAARMFSPEPAPEIIILTARDEKEMDAFFDFRICLKKSFLILVLPCSDPLLVERSYHLFPRFITYRDSDFSDVTAVLERIGQGEATCWSRQQRKDSGQDSVRREVFLP